MERKLDIGATLSRVFNLYGSEASVLLPAAALVFVPLIVIQAILYAIVPVTSLTAILLVSAISSLLALIGAAILGGVVTAAAQDMEDGRRDYGVGELFRRVSPAIGPLVAAGLLIALVIWGSSFLIGLLTVEVSPGFSILWLVWIVLVFLLAVWWSLVTPVIVVERPPVMDSFGRSRGLVQGNFWHVLAVIAVVGVIAFVVSLILGLIFGGGSAAIGTTPTTGLGSPILVVIGNLITYVLVAPLGALAVATLYFRLRALREGGAAAPPTAPEQPPPAAPAV